MTAWRTPNTYCSVRSNSAPPTNASAKYVPGRVALQGLLRKVDAWVLEDIRQSIRSEEILKEADKVVRR